eukprot:s909_g24.t1
MLQRSCVLIGTLCLWLSATVVPNTPCIPCRASQISSFSKASCSHFHRAGRERSCSFCSFSFWVPRPPLAAGSRR